MSHESDPADGQPAAWQPDRPSWKPFPLIVSWLATGVAFMVADLAIPVEIAGCPIVREPDGLALSSRNVYLATEERRAAAVLHRALVAAGQAISGGERRGDEVRRILRQVLEGEPLARIEYAEAVDGNTFQPLDVLRGQVVLPLAVRIGGTRLIDNFQLAIAE